MIQRKASEYTIQPGDEIEISVWGYDEFDTQRTVNTQGIITVPLVGEIEARGLSKDQFKEELENKLSGYIKGEINLSVSISSPQRNLVSVLGSVGRPDTYSVVDNSSLFEILSKAGGATDQADLRKIKIFKGGEATELVEIDLTNYLKKGNTSSLAFVYPGDIVYVPQQENMVRELSSFIRDVVLLFTLSRLFN
ncbi:MAG: polysaccharide biosynthesis/export family protein [Gracilimonas sp.]|uniref:polysaccharide biosynthesis/export family protein n=1 Tax=Gracilimonas sp. TaxID=1974203 RepID=UPI0019B69F72|nr:polysaccharide biosynthesis/export family protein [Gracilimonas sp.]MBD3615421.1 polysaccharide biosynthesis/export family protein [Gracilimonas sp.]